MTEFITVYKHRNNSRSWPNGFNFKKTFDILFYHYGIELWMEKGMRIILHGDSVIIDASIYNVWYNILLDLYNLKGGNNNKNNDSRSYYSL